MAVSRDWLQSRTWLKKSWATERKDATTVAGLVSEIAGRIPKKGEVVEEENLRLEVLQATPRRVERVRVSVANPQQMKLI